MRAFRWRSWRCRMLAPVLFADDDVAVASGGAEADEVV